LLSAYIAINIEIGQINRTIFIQKLNSKCSAVIAIQSENSKRELLVHLLIMLELQS